MRLLFLEWHLSSRMGGMELSMFEQCTQLAERGHDITIGYHVDDDLGAIYRQHGIRLIKLGPYAPRSRHILRDGIGVARNLARTLGGRFDAVVANAHQSSFFSSLVARMTGALSACHCRLNPPDSPTLPTRLGMNGVEHFIAVSAATRDLWVKRGCSPALIDVVHDGVDLERFKPKFATSEARNAARAALGLAPDDFVLLSIGRIDPVKDLEGAITTFANVYRREPRARFVIAGSPVGFEWPGGRDAYVDSLRALTEELGVSHAVRFVGQRSDAPEVFSLADVAVLFGKFPEPFGRVTCEALACGTPMVTPRQGGSVEILGNEFDTLMFAPGDYSDAARVLLSLASQGTRDERFAAKLRGRVATHFDVGDLGARVEASLAAALVRHQLARPRSWLRRGSVPRPAMGAVEGELERVS